MVTQFIMPWTNPETNEVFDIYKALSSYYFGILSKGDLDEENSRIVSEYYFNASVRIFLRKYGLPFNSICKKFFSNEFTTHDFFGKKRKKLAEELNKWFNQSRSRHFISSPVDVPTKFMRFADECLELKQLQRHFKKDYSEDVPLRLLLRKPKYYSMQLTHYLELPLEKWIGSEFVGMKVKEPFPPDDNLLISWNIRNKKYTQWTVYGE